MNKTAFIMKREVRSIASYRALIFGKYFLTILLGALSLYLGLKRYPMSPLYILIILSILPPILVYALKDYSKKSSIPILTAIVHEPEYKLTHLRDKYHYSRISYIANSISYLFALLLICLWQYNYNQTMQSHPILLLLPVIILVTGVISRFFIYIFYYFKLPYDLTHNKL